MRLLVAFLLLSMSLLTAPASAKWRKASTDHFVIYAEDSEKDLIRFSEYLERYHSAMAFLTGSKAEKPTPSNRVTIFAVGSERNVRKLHGEDSSRVAGFYIPRAGASRAFIPDVGGRGTSDNWNLTVLLHEYAHHFMISNSTVAMPRWFSEGGAEFFASASFESNGEVSVGRAANHRAAELFYADNVSLEELLDDDLYSERKSRRFDDYYGRSWLLYHYLTFEPSRRGQITAYVKALASGKSGLDAARTAFGDLEELEKELGRYLNRRRIMVFTLQPEMTRVGEISVETLSDGMSRIMPIMMASQRGVDADQAAELVEEARKIAARYPDDAGVQAALAEAEFDAGNDAAAIAAADRAIAADPMRKNAYVQKGYAMFRQAASAEDRGAAYAAAMKPFSRLNALENDHPLPLIFYYQSFVETGKRPPDQARLALEKAAMMAPYDKGLQMTLALMLADEGKIALASTFLRLIAFDPHGGWLADRAAYLLKQMADAPEGELFHPDWSGFTTDSEAEVEEETGG